MEVAFISDIHGNLEALTAVLTIIDSLKIKKIYCVGDIVGYAANPKECIEEIKSRKIPSVKGNHEYATITGNTSWFNPYAASAIEWGRQQLNEEDFDYLQKLPEKIIERINGYKLFLVHGSPRDPIFEYVHEESDLEELIEMSEADILVMGHTHVPFIKKVKNSLVVNCGAIGQPRDYNPKASFALFDIEKFEVKIFRVDYDINTAAKKIIKANLPSFLAQRLYSGI